MRLVQADMAMTMNRRCHAERSGGILSSVGKRSFGFAQDDMLLALDAMAMTLNGLSCRPEWRHLLPRVVIENLQLCSGPQGELSESIVVPLHR